MDSENDTLPLRPYQAIIWGPEAEAMAVRAICFAADGDDARRQAIQEYGEHCVLSLWNKEDADQPRSKSDAEDGVGGDVG